VEGSLFRVEGCHLVVGDLDALLISIDIKLTDNGEAGVGSGDGDQWMMARQLISGLPRQFMVMKASSRCSMRFHLLVPGERRFTVIAIPKFIGQHLQLPLLQANAVTIAAALPPQ
jgi:hypothetical protein